MSPSPSSANGMPCKKSFGWDLFFRNLPEPFRGQHGAVMSISPSPTLTPQIQPTSKPVNRNHQESDEKALKGNHAPSSLNISELPTSPFPPTRIHHHLLHKTFPPQTCNQFPYKIQYKIRNQLSKHTLTSKTSRCSPEDPHFPW